MFDTEEIDLTKPVGAHLVTSPSGAASGPNGHCDATNNRGSGYGVVTTLQPPPVTGANPTFDLSLVPALPVNSVSPASSKVAVNWASLMPRVDFPEFDGRNPKIWQHKCESYFELYAVPFNMWIKLATLNFTHSAAFWLQSVEPLLPTYTWKDFCTAVVDRFQRDQHNFLLRQFFHIRQHSTVPEYIAQFDELIHQIKAHDPTFNPLLVTSRFIDGLKHEIKSVVMIHKPRDLDTASSLALLQEELVTDVYKRDIKKTDGSGVFKPFLKQSLPNIVPPSPSTLSTPSAVSRSPNYSSPEEKLHVESTKVQSFEEKLAAVKAYRRAKGLCYKCGTKWAPNHKCAPTVSLHMVEELWQLLPESPEANQSEQYDSGEDLMAISLHAVNGTDTLKTIRVMGKILDQHPLILVDSGSSSSFIAEQMAAAIPSWTMLQTPLSVRVANGSILMCTHEIKHCPLLIQGHCFYVNLKILPLQCYDIVLGMDWLESFSPMEIHWSQKWLSFPYNGTDIKLQGLLPQLHSLEIISDSERQHMETTSDIWCVLELSLIQQQDTQSSVIPDQLQHLIQQYKHLFDKPQGLPPQRSHMHSIPFLPGAQPFRLRPYRYNLAQKDEIEAQVKEFLANGMIVPSSSPFASPVLLVKKKEW